MPVDLTPTDLHDAVLRLVRIDWRSAVAIFDVLAVGSREASIVVTGLRRLDCPHEQPWGIDRLGTICHARIKREDGGTVELELEMQTGDLVTAVGDDVSITESNSVPGRAR